MSLSAKRNHELYLESAFERGASPIERRLLPLPERLPVSATLPSQPFSKKPSI